MNGNYYLTITKKNRMDNSQDRNNISRTNIYINKNITELNEHINARAKLVYEKIGDPLKSTNKNQNLDRKFYWKLR